MLSRFREVGALDVEHEAAVTAEWEITERGRRAFGHARVESCSLQVGSEVALRLLMTSPPVVVAGRVVGHLPFGAARVAWATSDRRAVRAVADWSIRREGGDS